MQTAPRVAAGADDSQSVELRDRTGMAMTVLTLQQCWLALPELAMTLASTLRRMGGANGSRECAPDDRLRDTHHSLRQPLMVSRSLSSGRPKAGPVGSTHPTNRGTL